MADKPNRKRPARLVTLDTSTVEAALKVGKRQKPPIDKLSRLIDVALAEWTERHAAPSPRKPPKEQP